MTDLIRFVDRTIPGLGGADLLRLARLNRETADTARFDARLYRDIGLDRNAC